ncbi:MAG: hypothetical protein IIC82_08875 [Chloroflexi bacterium]|nr:hypothetical protein [Chloroflexota bacterium]
MPRRVDISGATWGSFLLHSDKWHDLTDTERNAVRRQLPFTRPC